MSRLAIRCFVFGLACAALCFVTAASKAEESADGLWTFRTSNAAPSAGMSTWWTPATYRSAEVDLSGLDAELANAPVVSAGIDVPTDGVEIHLPLPDGTFQRFAVVEKHLLDPAARQANPDLITYCGVGLDDSEATVTCTRSVLGFQCMIRRPGATIFIDPLFRGNDEIHSVYSFRTAMQGQTFRCLCEEEPGSFAAPSGGGAAAAGFNASGGTRLDLRLAVACTGEYYVNVGGTNALATAAITTTVNNVSAVFLNDAAINLTLLAPVLNTNPATDPYPRANLNAEVQADLDANVGPANYDVGHLFDSFGGSISGNAGCIDCVCTATKGSAWSDGSSPNPTGGNMTFLVLHEMGHQFGGRHTFSGTGCPGGAYDQPASVEPGSGSTIMSYSSICPGDEVLGPTTVGDLYYHADSLDRIVNAVNTPACAVGVASGNTAPTVNAGPDITIPMDTPFTLFASGADANDPAGNLTYCWEQMDPSDMQYAYNTVDNGLNPLFRSFPPQASPLRWFPNLSDLLAGNLFPGTLGEQLPTTNRVMEFWCTIRDNNAVTGGIDQDDVLVTVDAASGPFQVTSPNGGETIPVNVPFNVTWNVAGTDGAPINEASVQIQLWDSVSESITKVLAFSTPNDGSHLVTFDCSDLTTTARVRVVSLSLSPHTFFDFSDNDFEIADVTPPVVTCNILRRLLWPPRNGMLPVGFSWSQLPDDCDPAPTRTLSIYSTESDGAAPFTPDWMFVAPFNMRLRAQRAFPGPGRVYIVVVSSTDASGNRGRDCCTSLVPTFPIATHLIALQNTAAAAEAFCQGSPADVPPPGFVTLVSGIPLP